MLFPFFSIYCVPVKDEIIWYLSLTACLISLNIMLSSSIHALAKGISSFFLNWIVCLPGVESCELKIKPLSKISFANIFYRTVGSLFILLMFSLAIQKFFFYFDEVSFVYSFLYVPSSRGRISENIAA